MSRIAGRSGALYVAIASGGVAEPIAFLNAYDINFAVNAIDVTAFGDANKVSVGGLPTADGTYGGFYDNATAQMYTAAVDGVARKFYLYLDRTNVGQYFFGTAIFDFSVKSQVDGSVDISGKFEAASIVPKVG